MVGLSVLYAYFAKIVLRPGGAAESKGLGSLMDASAQTPSAIPSLPPNPNRALVPAQIAWEESSNRWFRLSGTVPDALIEEEIKAAAKGSLEAQDEFESNLVGRADCERAPWLSVFKDLPWAKIRQVRGALLTLNKDGLSLQGSVPTAADHAALQQSIQSAVGDLPSKFNLTVDGPLESRVTLWLGPDRTLVIGGTVGEGHRQVITEAVRTNSPKGMRVVNDVTESRFADAPEWSKRLMSLVPALTGGAKVERLELKGRKVLVEGIADRAGLAKLRSLVSNAFPAPLYQFESKMRLAVREGDKEQKKTDEAKPTGEFAKLVARSTIYYNRDAVSVSQLKKMERGKLERLAKAWPEKSSYILHLSGTLEGTANRENDVKLLADRCASVVEYLAENGVPKDAMLIDPPPQPGAKRNGPDARLVEFRLEGSGAAPSTAPLVELKEIRASELLPKTVVYFASKARIEAEDKKKLDQLGAALLAENITRKIQLLGFSDGRGSPEANQWITEERCKAVRKYLVSLGLKEDQFVLRPVAPPQVVDDDNARPQPSREEAAKLRRVEFSFEEEAPPAPAPTEPAALAPASTGIPTDASPPKETASPVTPDPTAPPLDPSKEPR